MINSIIYFAPRVHQLVEAQERLVRGFLNEAKKKFAEGDDDPKSGGLFLFRAYRGLPKYGPLIKFLSEPGIKVKLQKAENYYLADQQRNMPVVDEEYFGKQELHEFLYLPYGAGNFQ